MALISSYDELNRALQELENKTHQVNQSDLVSIKRECLDIQKIIHKQVQTFNQFEIRRSNEKIRQLLNKINEKSKSFGKPLFKFVGDPIPAKESQTLSSKINLSLAAVSAVGERVPDVKSLRQKSCRIGSENVYVHDVKESILYTGGSQSQMENHSGQIHIDLATKSIFQLSCNGPVFIDEVSHSVVVVDCHQLRLRRISNCTIYVRVRNNRVVVEECSNVHVRDYPQQTETHNEIYIDDFSDPTTGNSSTGVEYLATNVDETEFDWIFNLSEESDLSVDSLAKLKQLVH